MFIGGIIKSGAFVTGAEEEYNDVVNGVSEQKRKLDGV
jgi:hypothetical protein